MFSVSIDFLMGGFGTGVALNTFGGYSSIGFFMLAFSFFL